MENKTKRATLVAIATMVSVLIISCKDRKTDTLEHIPSSNVTVIGAMKNVMWNGELEGVINLDTIKNKEHLYGFGPMENLKGELLIIDGKSFQSTVATPNTMVVTETFKNKAPFFAYAYITDWDEIKMPDSIVSLPTLEKFLNATTTKHSRPFMFKLVGKIKTAAIHVVNLPQGTIVHSPADGHKGITNYTIINENVHLIGFFSTDHKTIFTHHDTFMHIHLITDDHSKMGHLDSVEFNPASLKLLLSR